MTSNPAHRNAELLDMLATDIVKHLHDAKGKSFYDNVRSVLEVHKVVLLDPEEAPVDLQSALSVLPNELNTRDGILYEERQAIESLKRIWGNVPAETAEFFVADSVDAQVLQEFYNDKVYEQLVDTLVSYAKGF